MFFLYIIVSLIHNLSPRNLYKFPLCRNWNVYLIFNILLWTFFYNHYIQLKTLNVWGMEKTQLIATSFIWWNASEWWVQVFFNLVRSARCERSLSLSHFYFVLFLFQFNFFSHIFLRTFIFISFAWWRSIPCYWFFSQSSSVSISL